MLRVACLLALVAVVSMEVILQAKLNNHWESFKSKHLKSYKAGEEVQRQENFKNNVERILEHNLKADLGEQEHRLAINEFSDMSVEEFKKTMLGYKASPVAITPNNTLRSSLPKASIPAAVDWRQYGIVTAIKNQGSCGSCYTFAAAGALESAWARATGRLVELSEQNLVDCASQQAGYQNDGCNGGIPDSAFQYIIDNGGIDAAYCYPYRMQQNGCGYNPGCNAATMSRFVQVPRKDEWQMAAAIAQYGPLSVGLDAGQPDFMSYKSGVYSNRNCQIQGNHAVQVVGYGSEGGKDYWLIKNSWGTSWGEQGYMKLARNAGNMCGIAEIPSFPIV